MFLKQNKLLLLGALVLGAAFAGVQFMFVQDNWAQAASKQEESDKSRTEWEKNFKTGDNLLTKSEAEKALDENNKSLKAGLTTLQQIEFGSKDSLQPYSEATAGSGDHKNFLNTKQKNLFGKAKSLNILCTSDLGLTDKISDDPVALNLFRLAVIESFFTDCNKAKVARVIKIQYFPPKLIASAVDDSEEDADAEKKPAKAGKHDKDKKDDSPPERADRLVQFPVKVWINGTEPAINKLVYEIQKPTERTRGYLCLRGFHIAVRQAGTGSIDAVLGFSALMNEKTIRDLGIQVNEDAKHGGGGTQPKQNFDKY